MTPPREFKIGDHVSPRATFGPVTSGVVVADHATETGRWLWVDFGTFGLHTIHETGVIAA